MSHSNVGRELTLKITITDDDKSHWIWDSVGRGLELHGVRVHTVSDGDVFKERDDFEEALVEIKERTVDGPDCWEVAGLALRRQR